MSTNNCRYRKALNELRIVNSMDTLQFEVSGMIAYPGKKFYRCWFRFQLPHYLAHQNGVVYEDTSKIDCCRANFVPEVRFFLPTKLLDGVRQKLP